MIFACLGYLVSHSTLNILLIPMQISMQYNSNLYTEYYKKIESF